MSCQRRGAVRLPPGGAGTRYAVRHFRTGAGGRISHRAGTRAGRGAQQGRCPVAHQVAVRNRAARLARAATGKAREEVVPPSNPVQVEPGSAPRGTGRSPVAPRPTPSVLGAPVARRGTGLRLRWGRQRGGYRAAGGTRDRAGQRGGRHRDPSGLRRHRRPGGAGHPRPHLGRAATPIHPAPANPAPATRWLALGPRAPRKPGAASGPTRSAGLDLGQAVPGGGPVGARRPDQVLRLGGHQAQPPPPPA